MNKRFCDVCEVELDITTSQKPVVDENGAPKRIIMKRYDTTMRKMVDYQTVEYEEIPNAPVIIQLNLNNHDMILKEYCKKCYKNIHQEVEKFWNILCATDGI